MNARPKGRWSKKTEEKDYPAAESFLGLLFDEKAAAKMVKKLKKTAITQFTAKDILRASELPLLEGTDALVKASREKLLEGKKLSPLLLVRQPNLSKVIIADGYHRLCAVCSVNEDAVVPCQII